jgi:CDP-6-deoxy-D-xylo-4-hexulose-3-dehydrase
MPVKCSAKKRLDWPLMKNNLTRADLDAACKLLLGDDPILTQARHVRAFESEWAGWLGVNYSVFVNSGSSANLLTMAALRELYGGGEIIVPTLTWVSDIASVLHCGFSPVFVDIDRRTLGMDNEQVLQKLTPRTRAVFLTHVLGYNGLCAKLVDELKRRGIPLIEDVCEAHGATFQGRAPLPFPPAARGSGKGEGGRKLGTIGLASNFSFYYAHHLSTIEGGMVCTNDADLYETVRMLRGHGLVRELDSESRKREFRDEHPDLNPEFIFALPGYNLRGTEIQAVIGRSQLKRLEANIRHRTENLLLFLDNLNPDVYQTDFAVEGSSNYALTLVLREANHALCQRVASALKTHGIEFRRGLSGGGNQLRQPYLRRLVEPECWRRYPRVEHVHFYGFYLGNYPGLERDKILRLCDWLNRLPC